MSDIKDKLDAGKSRPDLIPPLGEREVADVYAFGATKYKDNGWKEVPNARARYLAAAQRHVNEFRSGRRIDSESGKHVLAHAIADLQIVLELDMGAAQVKAWWMTPLLSVDGKPEYLGTIRVSPASQQCTAVFRPPYKTRPTRCTRPRGHVGEHAAAVCLSEECDGIPVDYCEGDNGGKWCAKCCVCPVPAR